MLLKKIILENKEIGARFKFFRQVSGKTRADFSREAGYPEEYILLIEKGKASPYLSLIEYFCSHYGLNLSWLVTGKGKIFKGKERYGKQKNKI